MSNIEIKRNLLGVYSIGYNCPNCNARLKSPLNDAGKTDSCPDCKHTFVVPGTEERERLRIQAEQKERQRAAEEKAAKAKPQPPTPPVANSPPPPPPNDRSAFAFEEPNVDGVAINISSIVKRPTKRYVALQTLIWTIRVIGALAAVVGVCLLGFVIAVFARTPEWDMNSLLIGLRELAMMGVNFLAASIVLFAFAESICVLLDTEENTRRTADNTEAMRKAMERQ